MSKTTKKRTFTKECKAEVVGLVRQADGDASKIARDIDLSPQTVAAWVRQAVTDSGHAESTALTTSERAELSLLRKEVRDLRLEREFLKKNFSVVREGVQVKFAAIEAQLKTYSL